MTALKLSLIKARSAKAAHWVPDTMTWDAFVKRVTRTDQWGVAKDSGAYVLGEFTETTALHKDASTECTDLHRRNVGLVSRCALTLDADKADRDLIENVAALGVAGVAHSTWSSTPDEPRWRVVLPLARTVDGDEFQQITAWFMEYLGVEQFDPASRRPAQMMFWPATPQGTEGERIAQVFNGPLINPDKVLAKVASSPVNLPLLNTNRTKRDPLTLEGTPGGINRAYLGDLEGFIDAYDLPYDKVDSNRWRLRGTTSMAGFGPIEGSEGLYYSHHANDPAWGEAVSLFDLYRLHRYSHLDEGCASTTPVNRRPSHQKACDDLVNDERLLREMLTSTGEISGDDDGLPETAEWMLALTRSSRTGLITDDLYNWELIADHDPVFREVYWDGMASAPLWTADPPWRSLANGGPEVSVADRNSLHLHLERRFSVRPTAKVIDSLLDDRAIRRWRHPVKDFLESLEWDGTPRVETCLPGVVHTEYTRLVARKVMAAAVARVMSPGIKSDHMLILHGGEGLGKTWWIERMSAGWSSTLGPLGAKDTLLSAHRSWIVNADESHTLRKADADTLKEFLTRTVDVFRSPYERAAVAHPRQFVFWATTNDETFLRQQEGNRRYLPVRVEMKCDFDRYTDEFVEQVWAEALHMWENGESLAMNPAEEKICAEARLFVTSEDPQTGMLQAWLEQPKPDNWDLLTIDGRMMWLRGFSGTDMTGSLGTTPLEYVCTLQLWVEALGRRPGEQKHADIMNIAESLRRLGWIPIGNRRHPNYGTQAIWQRPEEQARPEATEATPTKASTEIDFGDLI